MILVLQYILPLVFIGVGVWIRRSKDEALIKSKSPSWASLNESVCGTWPPPKNQIPPSSELK